MRALPLLAALLFLAGCVAAPEQRYIVRVLGGQGLELDVPVPVDAEGAIPEFVYTLELQRGTTSFEFVDTEHGPGLRVVVPVNGGQDVILSARQVGAQPLSFTMRADAATHWVRSTGPVAVSVILGDTTAPRCPETSLDAAIENAGWARVPVRVESRCA